MQIPKDILAEKNYTGTRIITIEDEKAKALARETSVLQKKLVEILDENKELMDRFDSTGKLIQEHRKEIENLNRSLDPYRAEFDTVMKDKIMPLEQEAMLIHSKIQAIVNELLKPQLSEFEKPIDGRALDYNPETDVMTVEVEDQIEKTIVKIRSSNSNK